MAEPAVLTSTAAEPLDPIPSGDLATKWVEILVLKAASHTAVSAYASNPELVAAIHVEISELNSTRNKILSKSY